MNELANRIPRWCMMTCAFMAISWQSEANIGRDPEAVYLDEMAGVGEIKLDVLKSTGVFGDRQLSFHTRNLFDGKVKLLAYHPDAYYVQSFRPNFTGWVKPEDFSPLEESFIAKITEMKVQAEKFASAIAKKTVIPGMTFDQVTQSIGKPNGKSFRVDVKGRTDRWTYTVYEKQTEYRSVSDRFGNVVNVPVVVKVPVGTLDVDFIDGKVVALQQEQSDDDRNRRVNVDSRR